MKIQEEQLAKLSQRYQEDEAQWKADRQELQKQVQDLYIQLERIKRETGAQMQAYKNKYTDYKAKVKQANGQINVLAARLAQGEMSSGGRVGSAIEHSP
jgi:uncharacterized protein involved in exopolysaccharide biosynthesis